MSEGKRPGGGARNWKHGLCYTAEYRVWSHMKGGRHYGKIPVCERWQSFENFLADMGPRPNEKHSIDRIDNAGIYEPSNCRWTTNDVQSRNKSDNTWLEYQGCRMILVDAARAAGLQPATVCQRLYKLGWSVEKALSTPSRQKKGRMNVAQAE